LQHKENGKILVHSSTNKITNMKVAALCLFFLVPTTALERRLSRRLSEDTVNEVRQEGSGNKFIFTQTVEWKDGDEIPDSFSLRVIDPTALDGDHQRNLRSHSGGSGSGSKGKEHHTKFNLQQDDDDQVTTLINGSFKTVINDDDETPICNGYYKRTINVAADSEDLHQEFDQGDATSCVGALRADAWGEFNKDTGCDELVFAMASASGDIDMACMDATAKPTLTVLDCDIPYPDSACNDASEQCGGETIDTTGFPLINFSPMSCNYSTYLVKLTCCPIF